MAANSYLIIDGAVTAALDANAFGTALAAAGIASVLIEDVGALHDRPHQVANLIMAGQRAGAAVLLDQTAIAYALGADGVHLGFDPSDTAATDAYRSARSVIGSGIVGVHAGTSRHHAMVLGELGADYVAFGGEAEEQAALVGWWAELFELPVVAWDVPTVQDCRALQLADTDFVARRITDVAQFDRQVVEFRRWLTEGA